MMMQFYRDLEKIYLRRGVINIKNGKQRTGKAKEKKID